MSRSTAAAALVIALLGAGPACADEAVDRCMADAGRGQKARDATKLLDARDAFLACADAACPTAIRKDCQRWFEEVKDEVPTIVPRLKLPSGEDARGATLQIDGTKHDVDGRPIALDPGPHHLIWEHAGRSVEQDVVVRAGEKNRLVDAAIVGDTKPKAEPAPPEPGPASPTSSRSPHPATWVLAGLGGLGVAGLIGFGASAQGEHDELAATCAPRCAPDQVDPVRRDVILANVSLGVAIAGAAGALTVGLATSMGGAEVAVGPRGMWFRGRF